jgi:predicted DNA-binding protein
MLIEERIFHRLLIEGQLDTLANVVRRDVTNELRDGMQEINSSPIVRIDKQFRGREFELKSRSVYEHPQDPQKGSEIDWVVYLQMIGATPKNQTMFLEGAWNFTDNRLEISIKINSPDGKFKPQFLEEMNERLAEITRHELEHFFQSEDLQKTSAEAGQKFFSNKSDIDARVDYYTNPAELPAFVAGINNLSKRTGKSFNQIVDEHMEKIYSAVERSNPDASKKELKKLDTIKQTWINFAKQKFPNSKRIQQDEK